MRLEERLPDREPRAVGRGERGGGAGPRRGPRARLDGGRSHPDTRCGCSRNESSIARSADAAPESGQGSARSEPSAARRSGRFLSESHNSTGPEARPRPTIERSTFKRAAGRPPPTAPSRIRTPRMRGGGGVTHPGPSGRPTSRASARLNVPRSEPARRAPVPGGRPRSGGGLRRHALLPSDEGSPAEVRRSGESRAGANGDRRRRRGPPSAQGSRPRSDSHDRFPATWPTGMQFTGVPR